jgi:hypothetical protein
MRAAGAAVAVVEHRQALLQLQEAARRLYGFGRLVPIRRGYTARFSAFSGLVVRR